ncbi:hypothetical protein [Pinisolibacter sp.]|uniref:hypothetical protein n=1 Tax=Pinisolibacter sp. TaxID=2172024 RepID=UPI002FDE97E5
MSLGSTLETALGALARHGRGVLVVGLLAGIVSPSLAGAIRPHIGLLIAVLLAIAAFRIGARAAWGALSAMASTLGLVVLLQIAVPLAVLAVERGFGLAGPIAMALLIMTTTAPIAGTPNLTILVGGDPAPALRLVVVATGLLPLTVVPVFLASGDLGDPAAVAPAALRLAGLIGVAALVGFGARARLAPDLGRSRLAAVDGLSTFVFAIVVIGVMEAIALEIRRDPASVAVTALAAFAANFGFQIVGALLARRFGASDAAPAIGIAAGNRNFILLLTALPDGIVEPIMLFVGCYQLPMYLTPLLLAGFYRRIGGR